MSDEYTDTTSETVEIPMEMEDTSVETDNASDIDSFEEDTGDNECFEEITDDVEEIPEDIDGEESSIEDDNSDAESLDEEPESNASFEESTDDVEDTSCEEGSDESGDFSPPDESGKDETTREMEYGTEGEIEEDDVNTEEEPFDTDSQEKDQSLIDLEEQQLQEAEEQEAEEQEAEAAAEEEEEETKTDEELINERDGYEEQIKSLQDQVAKYSKRIGSGDLQPGQEDEYAKAEADSVNRIYDVQGKINEINRKLNK